MANKMLAVSNVAKSKILILVLNFDIYSQFFHHPRLLSKCINWIERIGLLFPHVHDWLLALVVNYDLLLQEMHRHVLLRAGVQPSSAAWHKVNDKPRPWHKLSEEFHTQAQMKGHSSRLNKKKYQQRQTCVMDRSVLFGWWHHQRIPIVFTVCVFCFTNKRF